MNRLMIAGIAVLAALLLLSRMYHAEVPASLDSAALVGRTSTARRLERPLARSIVAPAGTPAIDLLARLEGRRVLALAAASTYFDSLFIATDSVLRRWPDLSTPLLVAIVPDSGGSDTTLERVIRNALAAWESTQAGIRFSVTSDTAGAQIEARTTRRFAGDLVGETHLEWELGGSIHSARITLAREDSSGRRLPPEVAVAAAIHEVGHALGLAHSSNPGDVMFPLTQVTGLSARDRATVELLYKLPLGPIRVQAKP